MDRDSQRHRRVLRFAVGSSLLFVAGAACDGGSTAKPEEKPKVHSNPGPETPHVNTAKEPDTNKPDGGTGPVEEIHTNEGPKPEQPLPTANPGPEDTKAAAPEIHTNPGPPKKGG